ncbi:anion exchange protein 4 [Eudromia elegans]
MAELSATNAVEPQRLRKRQAVVERSRTLRRVPPARRASPEAGIHGQGYLTFAIVCWRFFLPAPPVIISLKVFGGQNRQHGRAEFIKTWRFPPPWQRGSVIRPSESLVPPGASWPGDLPEPSKHREPAAVPGSEWLQTQLLSPGLVSLLDRARNTRPGGGNGSDREGRPPHPRVQLRLEQQGASAGHPESPPACTRGPEEAPPGPPESLDTAEHVRSSLPRSCSLGRDDDQDVPTSFLPMDAATSATRLVPCGSIGGTRPGCVFPAGASSVAERVGAALRREAAAPRRCPLLFVQLNELLGGPAGPEWRETARWMKFEETVEEGGERWSAPHVAALCLRSLCELRTCLQEGTLLLDSDARSFKEIIEKGKNLPEARAELSEPPLKEQRNNKLRKKLPPGAELASVLVGEVDFLEQPFIAFVRLREAVALGALAEIALPSRFLFILLGPRAKAKAYHEIGRAMATLLTDELFPRVAQGAEHPEELIAGIDEFLEEATVLPPGKWDPSTRISPPKHLPSPHKRISMHLRECKSPCERSAAAAEDRPGAGHSSDELQRTGRLFGGLLGDIRRKAPWYWSDFSDALHIQCLSAVLYIYLATVTNAITFGGMLGDATGNMQGVLESFLGTALAGSVFCLFAGQPLTILSSTGPVLVFERLLFSFSEDYGLDYLEFRLWIGLWVAFLGLVLVASEASYLVQYFTRFTEEGFCALISLIFIYDSMKKMASLADTYPINWQYRSEDVALYSCLCNLSSPGEPGLPRAGPADTPSTQACPGAFGLAGLGRSQCLEQGGHLLGGGCHYVPDVTLLSFLLFGGTFLCSTTLKRFKSSRYFPTVFRKLVSDFSIILAILIFCAIDAVLGLETPKLLVPSELKPTNPARGWIITPFGANPWWVCLLSVVPAVLVTILIFMDQQITAVILNRREYKLQKGAGFHLDLFCVSLLMIVTSVTGLPWYVSATVISLAHMESLKKESATVAPGEQPEFLGIREQRLTGLVVFILTGASVFMAPVLKHIPMPVLYGVFLHMGVAALSSIQLTERVQLLLMPAKHQPDLPYLRHVPLRRVHLFTCIQALCLAALWLVKSTVAAIIFPLMLLALVGIRKGLERLFSRSDLSWLDSITPESVGREAEGKVPAEQDEEGSEEAELVRRQGREINISVN